MREWPKHPEKGVVRLITQGRQQAIRLDVCGISVEAILAMVAVQVRAYLCAVCKAATLDDSVLMHQKDLFCKRRSTKAGVCRRRPYRRHCALRRAGRGARYHGRPATRDSDLVQGWYELTE